MIIDDKKLLNAVALIRGAARVKRFHTQPIIGENTVGQHTFNVIGLICACVPPQALRPQLLQAALLHDVPERVAGDVPSPTKRSAPGLKQAMDSFESKVLREAGIADMADYLSATELDWLKLADSLDGFLFCVEQMQMGNQSNNDAAANFSAYVMEKMNQMVLKNYENEPHAITARDNFAVVVTQAHRAYEQMMELYQ